MIPKNSVLGTALKSLALFLLFFALVLLVAVPVWVSSHFGSINLGAIVFTLSASLAGVPVSYIVSVAAGMAGATLLAALLAYLSLRLEKRSKAAC